MSYTYGRNFQDDQRVLAAAPELLSELRDLHARFTQYMIDNERDSRSADAKRASIASPILEKLSDV